MTIAIALKVGDGVVLGADSAATLSGEGGVANVYFNAEKLTNLVKGLPLGMASYGLGGLDGRSVTSLSKDLRQLFTGTDPAWRVDPAHYTMQWVAGTAVSAGAPEALNRLFRGWSSQVFNGMVASGIAAKNVEQFLTSLQMEPLIAPAMPLQDAIDLVKYMVDVTVGFLRFIPGPPTVAEPTDVAAITKHEGFRWVRRKHYYSTELNPPPVPSMTMDQGTPPGGNSAP